MKHFYNLNLAVSFIKYFGVEFRNVIKKFAGENQTQVSIIAG